ncbi:class I adenylate-forming enzyme family protein [Streptomyces sp. NPDC059262]|uniref:class I adenylate-forming enzyme family protein n=1 Tax=Streptomyces sp. NPDC059262 TaxID=3346797 RepID=UPI003677799B
MAPAIRTEQDTSKTWSQLVLHHLEEDPQAASLVCNTATGTITWSRAELARGAAGAADLLDRAGARPGESVAALLSARPASAAFLLAGALTERPLVALGPRMTQRELLGCLERLNGSVLVAERESRDAAAALAEATGRTLVHAEDLLPSDGALTACDDPDGIAFSMLTSGTTGLPKHVPAREAALAHRSEVNGAVMELRPGDRFVSAALFHHVAGLGNLAVSMARGATLVMLPSFSVDAWRDLEKVSPTHAITVPSVIETLLDADALRLPSLRVLAYGGSPMHPETVRRVRDALPGVGLVQLFGQTEGSPLTALRTLDHEAAAAGREKLLGSVGRAAPGVELRIHAPGTDGIGEVWARSSHSFVVDADGWQHTGDLGRLDDGYLYLSGRQGDKIICGGENVFPLEVEQVLLSHPQIREAAVVGVPDRRLGETVKALLVATDPVSPPDPTALHRHARERLAGFKVPTAWEFTDRLPRNASGKVQRGELTRTAVDEG